MIYFNTNQASQDAWLSLDEARQYYSTIYAYYLVVLTHEENSVVGTSLAQVPVVLNENVRTTHLSMSTVGLTLAGRYRYEVYCQTSAVNIDPNNVSVVGLLQRGTAVLFDDQQYFAVPDTTINNDIIYGA
jgi:hypothetical protein